MSEFLSFVEALNAGDTSPARLFGTDYVRRQAAMSSPQYKKQFMEAVKLLASVKANRRPYWVLKEAFATSDFPVLSTNILQWKLLQEYMTWPQVYTAHADVSSVPDFRTVKMSNLDGLNQPLTQVLQGAEYPEATLVERDYTFAVFKYGREFGVSFELLMNDFLRVFDRMPQRLAAAARNTEELFSVQLYAASNGPNATFFSVGNKNLDTGALTHANLKKALTAMTKQVDPVTGTPVMAVPRILEVPPALALEAQQILSDASLFSLGGAGATAISTVSANVLSQQGLQVVVNPFLTQQTTTNGDTSWYLWADKKYGTAHEIGFLAGHEQPELRQKLPNSVYLGGGAVPAAEGDFETDTIRWRIRHIIGGVMTDPRFAYASNGTT